MNERAFKYVWNSNPRRYILDCACGVQTPIPPLVARRLPVEPAHFARLTCPACGQQHNGQGFPMRLLTLANPKTNKSVLHGYLTAILHLAPADLSGRNVCQFAGACKGPCLNTAGMGKFPRTQAARVARTWWLFEHRPDFLRTLADDLAELQHTARARGLRAAFRPNGTSDLPWERIPIAGAPNMMTAFPDIAYYDYTKYPPSRRRTLPNYHLTFSLDVGPLSAAHATAAMAYGWNVAVPFRGAFPTTFQLGSTLFPVINGEAHDLRFLDPPGGRIIALEEKGSGYDTSGFFRSTAQEDAYALSRD